MITGQEEFSKMISFKTMDFEKRTWNKAGKFSHPGLKEIPGLKSQLWREIPEQPAESRNLREISCSMENE